MILKSFSIVLENPIWTRYDPSTLDPYIQKT
jgi:hypothetical protein